ncbi:unnamed protein product [Blepharisma stoltei]|uniref:Uncharacterized protein n=1 Tax=Blepharisma stoltei TaxID=1481888 RepID=A0AAU9KE47_9CILI|nr:unnamed protein product [Blepharisma stoltei]
MLKMIIAWLLLAFLNDQVMGSNTLNSSLDFGVLNANNTSSPKSIPATQKLPKEENNWSGKKRILSVCTDINCISCPSDPTCSTCADYYGVNSNGVCKACTDSTYCKTCDGSSQSTCTACVDHYGVDSGGVCQVCTDSTYCKICDGSNPGTCTTCVDHYGVDSGGACHACTDSTYCKTCDGSNPGTCTTCVDHYGVDSGGVCQACTDSTYCKTCDGSNPGTCTTCADYYGADSGGVCQACTDPTHCKKCDGSDQSICTACVSGYYVDSSNACIQCHISGCRNYLKITSGSGTYAAGATISVTVEKYTYTDTLTTSDSSNVYLFSTDSTANLFGTLSISYSSSSSGSTSVSITKVGTFTIEAHCVGFTKDSISITITEDTFSYIAFTGQPSGNACSGAAVTAYDQYGNIATSASGTITLIAFATTSGQVGKFKSTTVTGSLSSGVASSWSTCKILGTDTAFKLEASDSSGKNCLSNSFSVTQTISTATFTTTSLTASPGATFTLYVSVTDTDSDAYLGPVAGLSLTYHSGSALSSATYTNQGSGTWAVSASISTQGSYSLDITCTGCTASSSASVTISNVNAILINFPTYIHEGATSQTYQIKLSGTAPTSDVTVTISTTTSSSELVVNTASLTFTNGNYNTYQSVTIDLPYYYTSSLDYSIVLSHSLSSSDTTWNSANVIYDSSFYPSGLATLYIYDQDPVITVEDSVVVSQGGTATYQVSLSMQPINNVEIGVSASSSDITVSPATVTFTSSSWSSETFTVKSVSSSTIVGSTSYTLTYSLNADTAWTNAIKMPSTFETIVTVIQSSYGSLKLSNNFLDLSESQSGTYTVWLGSQPSDDVTVSISSGNSNVGVSPTPLTFTNSNYATAQTVTVTVNSVPSSMTNLYYTVSISHTTSSYDNNYNGLSASTTVDVVNLCTPAAYDWTATTTCSVTITNFDVSSGVPVPCSPGTYYSSGSCVTCPIGYYCPDGVNEYSCPSGHYQTATGKTSCTKVAEGYVFDSSSTSPTAVSSGSYSLSGSSSATSCKAGDMCPQTNIQEELKCPLGSYSSSTSQTSCTTCTAGKYCNYESSPTTCSGTYDYSPSGYNTCESCPYSAACSTYSVSLAVEGKYISSNAVTNCPSSQVCSVRFNFNPYTCPSGTTYSSNSCTECSTTTGCWTSGTTSCASPSYPWGPVCLTCMFPMYASGTCSYIDSSYKYTSTTSQTACSQGTFSPGRFDLCYGCSPGCFCNSGASTPLADMSSSSQVLNPLTTTAIYCLARTYNENSGIIDISMCKLCLPGFACPTYTDAIPASGSCSNDGGSGSPKCITSNKGQFAANGASDSETFNCPFGTYSDDIIPRATGADCTACTAGQLCPEGTSATPSSTSAGRFSQDFKSEILCPIGTYNSNTGQTSISSCSTCSTYTFCGNGFPSPALCYLGFTAKTTSSLCEICGISSSAAVCPASSYDPSSAISCSAGYFCPYGSYTIDQYSCDAGYYSLSATSTSSASVADCLECTAGTYCAAKSTSSTGASCSAGFYCLIGTPMSNYFACPPGYYSSSTANTDSSDCTQCTAGKACMTGTFDLSNSNGDCAAGSFCPDGTERPDQFACPAGTYSSSTSLTQASDCSSTSISYTGECAAGYYCPSGATKQYKCPPGTFMASTGAGSLASCTTCTAGYYCPDPSSTVNTAATVCDLGYYCNAGATAPLLCLPGYICSSITTTGTAMYAAPCTAGSLCPWGSSSDSTKCKEGFYCPSGTLVAYPCPPGTYRSTVGATALSDCSTLSTSGKYLDTFANTGSGTTCPKGYYCPTGTSDPIPCPAGTYNPSDGASASTDCVVCPEGKYCPYEATWSPSDCLAGKYCVKGTITPVKCPAGTYHANSGSTYLTKLSDCTSCDAGWYCDQPGSTETAGECKAGFYCAGKSITATPVGQSYGYICPAGSYCPTGTATLQPCPSGTFNNYQGATSSSDCIDCPKGFYCSSTTSAEPTGQCSAGYLCGTKETSSTPSGKETPAGTYAPAGSYASINCPRGTYNSAAGQGSCQTCDAGAYCQTTGLTSTTTCTTGHYCPSGTIDPIPCPPGTFRATTGATQLSECTPCTAGYYCAGYGLSAESGQCSAGYFCELASPFQTPPYLVDTTTDKYGPCIAGYYCPAGSTSRNANPCPAGTFNPSTLGASSSDCIPCTAGRACINTANVNDNTVCKVNYYCPQSSSSDQATQCEAGYRCPSGSANHIKCEPGTYQNSVGQGSCNACTAGLYCPRGTSDPTSNTCPAGHYCPSSTLYDKQYPCSPGTFSTATSAADSTTCISCSAGKYCDVYGVGDLTSLSCAGGFYCSSGSLYSQPMTGSGYGGICTRGYYCPAASSTTTKCDPGYYCSQDQMSTSGSQCSAGYYCTIQSIAPSPISSVNSAFSAGDICPKGYYCEAGSSTYAACPAGKYMPYKGAEDSTECISCPPGFYCDQTGTSYPATSSPANAPTACPAGYYCAGGDSSATPSTFCSAGYYCPTGSWEPIKCPDGQYQDQTMQSTCKTCSEGKYCESPATAETDCPAGHYCPSGTGYQYTYPCPVGTYNPDPGQPTSDACVLCDAGKYCETAGLSAPTGDCAAGWYCITGAVIDRPVTSSQGGICPRGSYCAAGSGTYTACTAGSYCNQQGLSAPVSTCNEGYWCGSSSTTAVPLDGTQGNICSAGTYCAAGASSQTNCPAGTMSVSKGLKQSSDCPSCPYGKYCATDGLTAVTGDCSAGYYCSGGSSIATQNGCTAGHYCEEGSFEEVLCDMGYYQLDTLKSSCDQCTLTNYCSGGTNVPTACPIGYYCPSGTRFDIEFPCPAGYYASTLGHSTCDDCPAGSVCDYGSSSTSTTCPIYSYCPKNTGVAPLCLAGTYNSATTGLTKSSDCTSCPAGSYCVDGRISDECEAGYLCVLASPTPTPTGSNAYGYQCPSGNYCTKGALISTACPSGLFRTLVGGAQSSDCTQCPPGSYCVNGNPNPISCPMGYYCPQGVNKPKPCPTRTYGSKAGATDLSACLACPGGYLCTRTGTGDYTQYPCGKVGYYCVVGATEPTPCPPGTYSSSTTAASIDDCIACPGGYYCPGASSSAISCEAGTYCPKGSPISKACPIGYYCKVNTATPTLCPSGYYCPKYDQSNLDQYQDSDEPPVSCPDTYVCPSGSFEPLQCTQGYYVSSNKCVLCPAGTYSDGTFSKCKSCFGGYVCVSGASRPNPISLEYHGGYECPEGYYCPVGSKTPTACPAATYNPTTAQTSYDACIDCPKNTYADTTGSAKCMPCGSNAYADVKSTTCLCYGKNRSYRKTDGSCVCNPNYHYIQDGITSSQGDSDIDCFNIVYDYCGESGIRDSYGNCVSTSSCSSECNGGSGKRMSGVGLCECDGTTTIDDICNKNCRENSLKTTYSNGAYTVTDPSTGETTTVDLVNSSGYYGKTSCSSSSCNVYSIDMTTTGPLGVYGLGNKLGSLYSNSTSRRYLAESSTTVSNPTICIQIEETFVFSIPNAQNYPIYVKDSLLNTNDGFDYGAFQELKRMIENPLNNITSFAFTFTEQGVYDFKDAADDSKHIIISVMGQGQQCLDPDIPIRPRFKSSMLTMGTQTKTNIIQDPNWPFIIGTACWLVGLVVLLILGIYFFHNKAWKYVTKERKRAYRDKQNELDIAILTEKPKQDSSDEESMKEVRSDVRLEKKTVIKEEENNEPMINDDIDPSIFQAMYDRLVEQDSQAKAAFMQKTEAEQEAMRHLLNNLAKLKKYLEETLGGLDDISDNEEEEEAAQLQLSPEEEMQKVMNGLLSKYIKEADYKTEAGKNLLYDSIINNPELSEKDKQDLIADFNANIQRIELALDNEKSKSQESLNKRLMERAAKRRQKNAGSQIESPSEIAETLDFIKKDPELAKEFFEKKKEIDVKTSKQINSEAGKLKEDLDAKLKTAKNKKEADAFVKEYDENVQELENRLNGDKKRQEAELAVRLRARKDKKFKEEVVAPRLERRMTTIKQPETSLVPTFFKEEDQVHVEQLEKRQEEEMQILYEKQAEEFQAIADEVEQELPISREDEKSRLETALRSSTNENERKQLLKELEQFQHLSVVDNSNQHSQLDSRLQERKRLRALKEAELKRKHEEERKVVEDKQEKEAENLKDDLTRNRLDELMRSNASPEEIARKIKDMMDDKHETELAAISAKKQAKLTEKQTEILQLALSQKADEIADIRNKFNRKRSEIEKSSLPMNNKVSELAKLEKKEADAMTIADYNFINNLNKEQDKAWREVESEFRQKLLDLADKHLQDTYNILQSMRSANPALLDQHLRQAQSEADKLRNQAENEYENKLRELDSRQAQLNQMQGERENEISALQKELDDADAKKRELAEMDRRRQEMADRQKQMIEEMKRRGISPEQMEEMIKKHQQETSEWEAAMERERQRQRERMQEKLNMKSAKHQQMIEAQIAKYKEDNMKMMQNKEDEKLSIKYPIDKPLKLYEPMWDIQTKLRISPLPVYKRNPVKAYADSSATLQSLLARVKRVEKIVENVDANQFENMMKAMEHVSGMIEKLN